MNTTREPVALGGTIQGVIIAVILLLRVFNIVELSDDQETAIVGLYLALLAAITGWQRSRVTPV